MDNICKECQKSFNTESQLHFHLRHHGIRQAAYYQKHYPRYDKYDNSIILFKSKDYYFNNDFNSRVNLRNWLNSVSHEEAKTYCRLLLERRKERKQLVYAPTQVELRTTLMPGMHYYEKLFGNYYELCAGLGLEIRFPYVKFVSLRERPFPKGHYINIDTRERKPLSFNAPTRLTGLKFGDYSLSDVTFSGNVVIERKSVGDLYGTLTNGLEIFKRELNRARVAGAYVIVLVESDFDSVYTYPTSYKVAGKVHISPESIFHNVRDILKNYLNVQFLFVKNRIEASEAIEVIFKCNRQYETNDLQYAYDTKQLLCGTSRQNIFNP